MRGPGTHGAGPIGSTTHSKGQEGFCHGRGSDLKLLGEIFELHPGPKGKNLPLDSVAHKKTKKM